MKSARTSKAEVTQVSSHGLWVLVGEREYFLDFDQYPWFAKGSIADVTKVQLLHGRHLRWPTPTATRSFTGEASQKFNPLGAFSPKTSVCGLKGQ